MQTECAPGTDSQEHYIAEMLQELSSSLGVPSFARLGPFDFPLGFARGFGKTGQAREGARPYTGSSFRLYADSRTSPYNTGSGRSFMHGI
jgi:hypothetical protein